VRFGLTRNGPATLGVYSVRGSLVRKLVDGPQSAGVHTVSWDGRDQSGARAAAGIYYYRLVTNEGRFEKRMVALP
jgi:flagellar hook assembly protein FlgD